uniref:Secreted protein n=1 Tax=Anopheles darlingi TaxID=43151 RepID=A0A2M4DIS9_ANODA
MNCANVVFFRIVSNTLTAVFAAAHAAFVAVACPPAPDGPVPPTPPGPLGPPVPAPDGPVGCSSVSCSALFSSITASMILISREK